MRGHHVVGVPGGLPYVSVHCTLEHSIADHVDQHLALRQIDFIAAPGLLSVDQPHRDRQRAVHTCDDVRPDAD